MHGIALYKRDFMIYHDNDVELCTVSSEEYPEVKILSGTFTVTELSITSGQDKDGLNHVGDVHTLGEGGDHKFRFRVGRKGSSQVADWFNDRVPGNRTTFNHTAGELNFAFIGTLNLIVSGSGFGQNQKNVSFDNVAFAQGHTVASNNWWFGGKTAQNTHDGDYPESVICFGRDENDKEVVASFMRGVDTAVSVVCFLSVSGVDEPKFLSNKISGDVTAQFNRLLSDGNLLELTGRAVSYDVGKCHFQGFTQYGSAPYFLATYNVLTADYAHIISADEAYGASGYATYGQGWRHPGGIQTIGDYLLVPSEKDDESLIAMYDLRGVCVKELPRVEQFLLQLEHKAGCLGIVTYADPSSRLDEYYLLIVGDGATYHVYKSQNDTAVKLPDAKFNPVGSFTLKDGKKDIDCQGFGLVTGGDDPRVYMIALMTFDLGTGNEDWGYLYEIDTTTWQPKELVSRHFYSKGGLPGLDGVHFRWGAGIQVTENGQLVLLATARNLIHGTLFANCWIAK
jgi:hypothetical protein